MASLLLQGKIITV